MPPHWHFLGRKPPACVQASSPGGRHLARPSGPCPAHLSSQAWSEGPADALRQGLGVPRLLCAVEKSFSFSLSPTLFPPSGKRAATSPRAARGWAAPRSPWRPLLSVTRPPTTWQAGIRAWSLGHRTGGVGLAAGPGELQKHLELGATSPPTLAPGKGPRKKKAIPEVGELGPSSLSLPGPKRAPPFPWGPLTPAWEGEGTGNRNL